MKNSQNVFCCNISFFFLGFRAAYKGFADCIRLLLFLDAYRGRQDKEGKYHLCSIVVYVIHLLCISY